MMQGIATRSRIELILVEDLQARADRDFARFVAGRLTRAGYVGAIDALWPEVLALADEDDPPRLLRSLRRRMDGRSLGQFALSIFDHTIRERFLVREWAAMTGRCKVIGDDGISNDGRLIIDARGRRDIADYRMHGRFGPFLLEMKAAPHDRFFTYKVDDLDRYEKHGGIIVLTLVGTQKLGSGGDPDIEPCLDLPDGLRWFVMDASRIGLFRESGEAGHHKGFGGKPTVRLYRRRFKGIVSLREWGGVHDAHQG